MIDESCSSVLLLYVAGDFYLNLLLNIALHRHHIYIYDIIYISKDENTACYIL